MTLSERDKKLVWVVVAGALIIIFRLASGGSPVVETSVDSAAVAEKQLARLRLIVATEPAKEALYKQASARLAEREKGVMKVDTAEQAQAQLLQIVRGAGKAEDIDARGGEFGPIRSLGDDYGEVSVAVSFECGIEQLVNFLSALTASHDLLATNEIQISSANPKLKTVNVRLVLATVVARKLVPEKKGFASF
jgi:Type II secretion system (T2SS), protein M subtype b